MYISEPIARNQFSYQEYENVISDVWMNDLVWNYYSILTT